VRIYDDPDELKLPLIIGSTTALGLYTLWTAAFPPQVDPNEPSKALVTVALLILSIGLSLLAAELLKKKNKSLAQDDKPTALATRGTFVPRLIGRRRLGYVFCAAGNRQKAKEKAEGGKGSVFSAPKVDVFREDGWHAICVGPAWTLYSIEQQGKPIFTGPISRESHPSGSTINLGNEGSFRIFWGQNGVADGQPINSDPSFTSINGGISSSWPHLCYIQWISKRLGPSPNWPLMTYVFETQLQSVHLSMSSQGFSATQVLGSQTYIVSTVTNGTKGTAKITVLGDANLGALTQIQLSGNTGLGTPTDFTVFKVTRPVSPSNTTDIFTNETISGATNDGTVSVYVSQGDDGLNIAHILAELLYDPWPHGIGQPKTGSSAEIDINTLEDLGTLTETEDLRCSVIAPDAQDLQGLIGGIMQDIGCFLALNFRTGLLEFVPLRDPSGGTLANVTYDLQTKVPEIRGNHSRRPVDRLVFSFTDQDNQYRDMTITVDDDGQAAFAEFYRQRVVQIISTIFFDTASLIAARRELEEMAGAGSGAHMISCNRGCRRLIPGQAILVDGFNEVMRVTKVIVDPESGEVQLHVMPDFYGAPLSQFKVNGGNTGSGGTPVEADLSFGLIEVPEILTGANGPQTVLVPRIRAHSAVLGSDIYLSPDNSTFTFEGNDGSIMTGGTLDASFPADSEMDLSIGPQFTALGVDIGTVLDLSSDLTAWRAGRQLAVAINAAGEQEIMFLQRIVNVVGSTYEMRGLIRGRYDTRPIDLAMGDVIYILEDSDGLLIQDNVILTVDSTVYAKSAPTGVGTIPLSTITAFDLPVYGKGPRPVQVSDIRLDTGSGSAGSGTVRWSDLTYRLTAVPGEDDLDFLWAYSNPQSPGAGAGQSGYGTASPNPAPEGDFIVEVLNLSNTLLRTETVSVAAFTYTETDRLADFASSEPAGFKLRITQVRGGQLAEPVTQTFTNVT